MKTGKMLSFKVKLVQLPYNKDYDSYGLISNYMLGEQAFNVLLKQKVKLENQTTPLTAH
jgi:hypothetical protein